jgi:membrane dipeptidase
MDEPNKFGYGAPFVGDADQGMTAAGHDWIAEMHRLHLLIDLSHCGHKTSADYLAASKQPVVFSHATFGPRGRYPNITGILGPWYEWDTRLCSDYSSLAHTPRIWDAMRKRGYSASDIEKVTSKNWLRVLRDVWG